MEDKTAGKRAAAYWFIDGLPEMLYGFVFCAFGVVGISAAHVSKWVEGGAIGTMALLAFSLPAWDRKVLDWLKSRITYPRTGYVRPPAETEPPNPQKPISLFGDRPGTRDENVTHFRNRTLMWMVQATNLGLILHSRWSMAFLFAVVAIAIYVAARDTERPYSLLSVAILGIGGVAGSLLNPGEPVVSFLPSIWGGTWLLLLGLVKFLQYMHAHPEPEAARA